MLTACELTRPPVEAVASRLKDKFGSAVFTDRVRQFCGHATKQIVATEGYRPLTKNIKVVIGGLFTRATKYYRPSHCGICGDKLPRVAVAKDEYREGMRKLRLTKFGVVCTDCAAKM